MSKEHVIAELKRQRLEREKAAGTSSYVLTKGDVSNSAQAQFNKRFYEGKA